MQSGRYAGRYAWVVNVPLQINYQSPAVNVASRRMVNVQMTIVRTSPSVDNTAPNIDGLQGIGISQLLVKAATSVPGSASNPARIPAAQQPETNTTTTQPYTSNIPSNTVSTAA
jgi:hypothetical protein